MRENSFAPASPTTRNKAFGHSIAKKMPYNRAGCSSKQIRSRAKPLYLQTAQNDRSRRATGNSECQRWHHRAAGCGVVGSFGSGDTFDSAFAELLGLVRPALGFVVADHRGHRAAFGGQDADKRTDTTGAQYRAADSRKSASDGSLTADTRILCLSCPSFCACVNSSVTANRPISTGNEMRPLIELRDAECESLDAGRQVDSDRRDQQSDAASDQVLDRRFATNGREHRQTRTRRARSTREARNCRPLARGTVPRTARRRR